MENHEFGELTSHEAIYHGHDRIAAGKRDSQRPAHLVPAAILFGALMLGWALISPASAQTTVTYLHTDALGSVVAESDAGGNMIQRTFHEAYGTVVGSNTPDGPGYAGHVSDGRTGLSQMQQRYMDPQLGLFLSVDPVTAYDKGDLRHFNRYAYAYNNPYSFADPDGRCPQCLWGAPIGAGVNLTVQLLAGDGSFSERWSNVSWGQVGVAAVAGGLSGGVSAIASTATTTVGAVATNVIGTAGVGALATQANAQLEGRTASVGEVVTGAALSGGASGAGAAIQAAPRALARSASSGMSQTERTATANLLYGIRDATPGFSYSNPTQTAANVLGSAVSSSPDLQPLIEKEKTR